MFDYIHPYANDINPTAKTSDLVLLQIYLQEHGEALTNPAALLGGRRGARLAQSAITDLSSNAKLSRRTAHALKELRAILSLEHVHDEDREEAGFFAIIDPADPVVDEICLLSDGFNDALDRLDLDVLPLSEPDS